MLLTSPSLGIFRSNRGQRAPGQFFALAAACALGCSGSSGGTAATGGTLAELATGGAAATGGAGNPAGGASTVGGTNAAVTTQSTGGSLGVGGVGIGGASNTSGNAGTGGASRTGGAPSTGGATGIGGATGTGGASSTNGGVTGVGGASRTGGATSTGGQSNSGGTSSTGGSRATGGAAPTGGTTAAAGSGSCSGPIGTLSGPLATGIIFKDTDGKPVNAHGGGIIKEGNTYYMHGEYFLSTTTDNNFNGFSMYSSQDMATWKNEGIILPQQASGLLGPNRKGERPHIIKCPATGEFVLYAHAADVTYQADKEVVYATSNTVNGQYTLKGSLTNSSGTIAAHSDMSAITDGSKAYVITESAHVYALSSDCHSWVSDTTYSAVNGTSGGGESPTIFKAGSTYYWIMSNKTGWRANNNFYSTASAITGPWTYQGYLAPVTDTANNISDERTWLSQSTWVMPITGCNGTVYVYWGDHWYGTTDTTAPGKHNDQAGYVFQPFVFTGTKIFLPTYLTTWKLDVGAGTWSQ